MIRPSYVLGGRAMEIVRDDDQLDRYIVRLAGDLTAPSELVVSDKRPLLLDRYLSDAIEVGRRLPRRRQGHRSSPASWSTSRRPASHSGDFACACRRHHRLDAKNTID